LTEGASTITQQYARNLFLNYEKTWSRKIDEAMLALELETHYSKEEILEGYLNTINYGGVYGIENASYYYFGHSSSSLNLAEASMLAGIPQSPSNYSPFSNEELAKKRQRIVLNSMVKNGDITEEEADDAYNSTLIYNDDDTTKYYDNLLYFRDAVIEELYTIDSIPQSLIETGGLKIYTTLDSDAQEYLEEAISNNMEGANSSLQVAGIMIDPDTGGVMALMGGVDYNSSVYNRATDAVRQVGSTMKPYLYYTALENGFTSASSFISEKTTFSFSNGTTYTPKNYNDTYANKAISMGAAISYSDNIYAVKTHLFLGEEMLVNTAKKLGITSELSAIPSLALGTEEISLIDMVTAYSDFASMGYKNTSHFITRIEDKDGNVLYEYDDYRQQILDENLCYILNEMLTYTYDSSFVDYNYPTVISLLPKMTNKYAIKTGTTNTDLLVIILKQYLVFGLDMMIIGLWELMILDITRIYGLILWRTI
jgi:membrane peptidoglycan carboxypeptidase